jgi:hypothetical protein
MSRIAGDAGQAVAVAAAYLANRDVALVPARARTIGLLSGALGIGALLMFAVEAAVPPAVMVTTFESLDIAAPPAVVWHVLT